MDDLEKLRAEINAIDERILKALAGRRDLVARIIAKKAAEKLPLRDARREEDVLERLISMGRSAGLDAHFVTRVFHEVIDDSVRLQQLYLLRDAYGEANAVKRVAFQGIEGAYSFLAAQKHFAHALDTTRIIGYPTFGEVVDAVEGGTVDFGFLPIENTTAGSINEVYDLLAESTLSIIGEEVFRVEHCLLGVSEAPLSSIRRVYSHPQALAQCMKFLSTLADCQVEYFADTAMAARKVKEDQDPAQAAVASEAAARQYGLVILKRDLADQRENYTRFLVVSRRPIAVPAQIPAKTSLVLAVSHEEGALLKALMVFHEHKVNLTKLDGSRPRRGSPFQYLFNVDFEGNIADANVGSALDGLRGATSFLKILGTYPIGAREKTQPTQHAMAPPRVEPTPTAGPRPAASGAEPDRRRPSSRGSKAEGTVITVRGVRIGGRELVVIAGPACIESREHVLACARQVKECGGKVLYAGCFPGHGAAQAGALSGQALLSAQAPLSAKAALDALGEAGRVYDLPVMTEVESPGDVAAARSVDIIRVSGAGVLNRALLEEVGRLNRPVILERGPTATLEDILTAADVVLARGNQQVVLCESGVRSLDGARRVLDLGAVAALRQLTHLPVAVDPSRGAASRELVPALVLAARAVSPSAIAVDLHPDPDRGSSNGGGALSFPEFANLMHDMFTKR